MPPDSKTHKRHIRPVERQPMRDWLIERLDLGDLAGLTWVDRTQGKFKIKWCHGSRHGRSERDADVFEQWAKHTGRHYEGKERNPKRWKPNFRCALNSLKTVRALEKSLKGSNAFREFKILDFATRTPIKEERKEKRTKNTPQASIRTASQMEMSTDEHDEEVKTLLLTEAAADEMDVIPALASPLPPKAEKLLPLFEKISPGLGANFEYGKRQIIKHHTCGYTVTQVGPPAGLETAPDIVVQNFILIAEPRASYNCPDTPEDSVSSSPMATKTGDTGEVCPDLVAESIEISCCDDSEEVYSGSSLIQSDHFPLTPPDESCLYEDQSSFDTDSALEIPVIIRESEHCV